MVDSATLGAAAAPLSAAGNLEQALTQTAGAAALNETDTRMIAVTDGFSELDMRWGKPFGSGSYEQFFDVTVRRTDLATLAVGNTLSGNYGRLDIWVVAVDGQGELLWQHSYGGPRDDRAHAITELVNGHAVLAGDTFSERSDSSAGIVIEIDENGKEVWTTYVTDQPEISLRSVSILPGGEILVGGSADGAGYIARLAADGSQLWSLRLSDGPDTVLKAVPLSNGKIVVAGTRTALFDADAVTALVTTDGTIEWTHTVSTSGGDAHLDVAVDHENVIYLAGTTFSDVHFEQGSVVILSADGEEIVRKDFGGFKSEQFNAITIMNDGSLLLGGHTANGDGSSTSPWVVRLSSRGDLVRARVIGENNYAGAITAAAPRSDGTVSLVGFSKETYDASRDAYVALIGSNSRSVMQPVYEGRNPPTVYLPGGELATDSASVEIMGNVIHSRPIRQVFVDGQPTELLPNGAFIKNISVPMGQSLIAVEAVDDQGVIGSAKMKVIRGSPGALDQDALDSIIDSVDFGDYHAIIIGNNDYGADIPSLDTAANDAREIARVLEGRFGFSVQLLINATRADIVGALETAAANLGPRDNLVVYYAGHGYYDEDVDLGYWLPVDAELTSKEHWIRNSTITDSIKEMNANHVLLIADSCFSGTLLRSANVTRRTGRFYEQMASRSARLVMTSGGIEPVLDGGGDGHSVFARNLIERLSGEERIVDGTSLYQAVREPVVMVSEQVPQYSNIRFIENDGGDFLFVRRK